MKRAVPQSWGTSNGTFKMNKVGEVTLSFVEYSLSKSIHLTPDIVEYEAGATAPLYDLIIGKQTLHEIGAVLDFKEKTITIDNILLPMRNIVNRIQSLGIEVIHILPGCTYLCQPVDIGINKSLKAGMREKWEDWMMDGGGVEDGVAKEPSRKMVAEWVVETYTAMPETIEPGLTLIRREYPTAVGPVDLLCRDTAGQTVAIEIKRRGEIDGVEQLTRYIDCLHADSALGKIRGIFVAQSIKPQARVLAESRNISWCEVDYDELRGKKTDDLKLF